MTEATTTLEQEIATLRSQLSEREKALRETRQAIDKLTQAPHFRAQQIRELEEQLSKKRVADEICQGQALEYVGSDMQVVFEREAKESVAKLKEYEKLIQETRWKHAQQDTKDNEEKHTHQYTEQTIMRSINTLKEKLQALETQQDEKRRETAEKAYQEYEALYLDMLKTEENSKRAQQDVIEALADYPELQQRFLEKYDVPEPTDGVSRIARAFIEYLEALIEDGEQLQGVTIFDGTMLSETLGLTDVEVMAHSHEGGIDLLQRKRAALLRFA